MKYIPILIPIIVLSMTIDGHCQDRHSDIEEYKPRVIISTDFPPLDVIPGDGCEGPNHKCSDPDDIQSMVRFLQYSNEFEVEALIPSAGTFAFIAEDEHILDVLDHYDKVDETLRTHDPDFPRANYLRSVTYEGRDGTWGEPADEILGKGMDSEASEAIIDIVDHPDPRPVWVCVWGGPREVAQAIWKVKHTRSPAEVEAFINKLRIYQIGLGDDPGQDGSGQWMLDQFPDLFVISSQDTYGGMAAQNSELGNLEYLSGDRLSPRKSGRPRGRYSHLFVPGKCRLWAKQPPSAQSAKLGRAVCSARFHDQSLVRRAGAGERLQMAGGLPE